MSGRVAKNLRKLARKELIEKPPERELVASAKTNKTAVNSPNSVRGFYLALKKANKAFSKSGARIVRSES